MHVSFDFASRNFAPTIDSRSARSLRKDDTYRTVDGDREQINYLR